MVRLFFRLIACRSVGAGVFALVASFHNYAMAQSYPIKTIRFVVPNSQGGNADILTRVVADAMAKGLGQSMLIDNRPGGSSSIGTAAVAKALPDGYTILMIASTFAIITNLFPDLPYDALRDFAPVRCTGRLRVSGLRRQKVGF